MNSLTPPPLFVPPTRKSLLRRVEVRLEPRPILNAYTHELNSSGTGCAKDCRACRWAEEHSFLLVPALD